MSRIVAIAIAVAGLIAAAAGLAAPPAEASSLSVSPITIERTSPAAAATLTLNNAGDKPINAQVRVFRWTQVDGKDRLESTRDVVVSPPMIKLKAGVDYTVRVVRVSKAPVASEESYRVVVDELPQRSDDTAGVNLLVRYSIPVFFRAPGVTAEQVVWRASAGKGRIVLTAENNGGTRFKVGKTTLVDAAGKEFQLSAGLVGYVLGGASMSWTLKPLGKGTPRSGSGTLRILSDGVGTDAPVSIRSGG